MRALDLFCGAGGATMGLMRAGFDVTGIDNNPKRAKRYPGAFICADALNPPVDLAAFDFVWASPPCQRYSSITPPKHVGGHADHIQGTRDMLDSQGLPYVIENVPRAPIRPDVVLVGSMFGLDVVRRRHFEVTGFAAPFDLAPVEGRIASKGELAIVTGHSATTPAIYRRKGIGFAALPVALANRLREANSVGAWRRAMGIDWMTQDEIAQAIPPAYAEYIARAFLRQAHAKEAS